VIADGGTVVNIHRRRLVDENPHQPAMIGKLTINKLVAESPPSFSTPGWTGH